jgi:cytochrome c2
MLASGGAAAFAPIVQGGNAARGAKLIGSIGCGACHSIPGIEGAEGKVGPPLTDIGERGYIGGVLANTPENMIIWLKNPQAVVPGNAMPNLGLNDHEARDIAAYLYTLR